MANLRSIKNFTISFTGTEFGNVEIEQLVADGTMISHGWVTAGGATQAGLKGGSTIFDNPNTTYQVVLTLPVDNENMRTLEDIFDFGKNDEGSLPIGAFFLKDGNNGRSVSTETAYIEDISDDAVTTDTGAGREVTFTLANAKVLRV